jgi:hypothetical protein
MASPVEMVGNRRPHPVTASEESCRRQLKKGL